MDATARSSWLRMRVNKVVQALRSFFWKGWLIYLALTICSIVFVAPFVWYPRKWEPPVPHVLLLIVAVALGVLLTKAMRRLRPVLPRSKRGYVMLIAACTAALFATQVALTYAAGFYTDWDVEALIKDIWTTSDRWYFSVYTNQVFLEGLFRRLLVLTSFLPVDNEYQILTWFGCLSVSLSAALVSLTAYRLDGPVSGFAAFVVTAFLWGLSPWVLVPYSDSYGILWPIAVLFCYVCLDPLWLKLAGMVVCSVIGYHVKPTVVFVAMAVVVIEALHLTSRLASGQSTPTEKTAKHLNAPSKRNVLACALSVALSLFVATSFCSWIEDWGIYLDPNDAYTATHYLMMGVNDFGGVWSAEDIEFSNSYHTVEERQQANIQEWKRRVGKLGPSGVASLVLRKNLSNYADGSFSWAGEGSFFVGTYGNNEMVKRFFGIREADEAPIAQPFRVVYHTVWLTVLVGIVLNAATPCDDRRLEVAALSLSMLSIFLLVFECRARYLFLYGPLFALLAVRGWKTFASLVPSCGVLHAPSRADKKAA